MRSVASMKEESYLQLFGLYSDSMVGGQNS